MQTAAVDHPGNHGPATDSYQSLVDATHARRLAAGEDYAGYLVTSSDICRTQISLRLLCRW